MPRRPTARNENERNKAQQNADGAENLDNPHEAQLAVAVASLPYPTPLAKCIRLLLRNSIYVWPALIAASDAGTGRRQREGDTVRAGNLAARIN